MSITHDVSKSSLVCMYTRATQGTYVVPFEQTGKEEVRGQFHVLCDSERLGKEAEKEAEKDSEKGHVRMGTYVANRPGLVP